MFKRISIFLLFISVYSMGAAAQEIKNPWFEKGMKGSAEVGYLYETHSLSFEFTEGYDIGWGLYLGASIGARREFNDYFFQSD